MKLRYVFSVIDFDINNLERALNINISEALNSSQSKVIYTAGFENNDV